MQITLSDEIVEKLKTIHDPEAFVNSILKEKISKSEDIRGNIEKAVAQLMADYRDDGELTIFTDLDGDDFYAEG
jgi:hypothetical protein